MKRIIATALAALLLFSLTTAMAGSAGTAMDPLITVSYIEKITPLLEEEIGNRIDDAMSGIYTEAEDKLDEALGELAERAKWEFASTYEYYVAQSGTGLVGRLGTSVIVTSGTVSVTFTSGAVIEVPTGTEIASGTQLKANTRYFCTEDTEASFIASERAIVGVNGAYAPKGDVKAAVSSYTDVTPYTWYYDSAEYARENELFHDSDAEKFRGNDVATRGEMVYALWVANGAPMPTVPPEFTDLTEDWYVPAIAWASENGLVEGYGNGIFRPDQGMRREEFAVIMYRYAQYMGRDTERAANLSSYSDAIEIADWAFVHMAWANAEGLITGVTNTELRPRQPTTRAHVATIILRYVGSQT